nr:MAG TPA: hypothetical protein [Caudoviricetes sp.]
MTVKKSSCLFLLLFYSIHKIHIFENFFQYVRMTTEKSL